MSAIPDRLYPCDLCGIEHERSALMAEGPYLICRECWEEGFKGRFFEED